MLLLSVWAATETELKERKYRIEDALNATRAAVEEGFVSSGGTALINVIPEVEKVEKDTEGDEATGVAIVRRALKNQFVKSLRMPVLKALIVEHMKTLKPGEGYNAATDKYENMVDAGIVDPTKVTRSALQNAASVSALLLTTEAVVADEPKDDSAVQLHLLNQVWAV